MVPGVPRNPLWAAPSTKKNQGLIGALESTDDGLNGNPLSGYGAKKTTAMAHLRVRLVVSLKKTNRNGHGF